MKEFPRTDGWRNKSATFAYRNQLVSGLLAHQSGEGYFDATVYKHLEDIVCQREHIQCVISFPLLVTHDGLRNH